MTNYTLDPEGEEVVFASKDYRGWRAIYVGCGQMTFTKGRQRIAVNEDVPMRKDWMAYCWRAAKTQIDEQETQP